MKNMIRKFVFAALALILSGCSILTPPPARFPQLNERAITSSGNHALPQYSPDGKYLAYIDDLFSQQNLVVYEIQTGQTWTVASRVGTQYFGWANQDHLSYFQYRPDLSGSPFPEIKDLHLVDITGKDDRVVMSNLYSPGNFVWLPNGHTLIALLSEASSRDGSQDIYQVDTLAKTTSLIVSRQMLNTDILVNLSLSSDGNELAIYNVRYISSGINQGLISIYDLNTQTILKQIVPAQSFSNLTLGDDQNSGWIKNNRWLLFKGDVPEGNCYNYALFFFNVDNPINNFCMPSTGIIADPTLSPDLSHLAYVSVIGPGADYLMLADLTPEYRSRLEK